MPPKGSPPHRLKPYNRSIARKNDGAENAAKDNPGIAQGLNSGITYLMFLPYILMLVVALVFWRKLRRG